jgi:methylmalonyl-CoA mutase, N-terminal domain
VAFDLPTQMGYDSSAEIADGEVGKVGVAIDTVEDMKALFDGIPLDEVSTSMTINAPASLLLLMYQIAGEEQGVAREAARHDPERRAQGVHRPRHLHLPAGAEPAADRRHLRLLRRDLPQLQHHLDLRLPHGRGRGDAGAGDRLHARRRHRLRAGGRRRRARRRRVRAAAELLLRGPLDLLEEVAKFRAARRMWAGIMRDRFGAKDPKSP